MISCQLAQFNNNYGNQYYIPYSIGVLTSFARQDRRIAEGVGFPAFLYKREAPERIADRIGQVDVLGLSCYVWNWRLSLAVASEVRRRNPDVLIVVGGPHVPEKDPAFLRQHPGIDVAVHGEGEGAFQEILLRLLAGEPLAGIPSTAVKDRSTGEVVHTPKRTRMRDLSDLPSPYLAGTFDPIMHQADGIAWMALWETNRGCPFACTFCDWGSATASKVIEFDWQRLMAELAWFTQNRIGFVFGCDANFGIRKRDVEIARALVAAKREHGFPQDFRVCFTKNSTHRIFELASIFHDGGMLKGVSLSMQSLDAGTLEIIKRDNIKLDVFADLQQRYNSAKISTYTELIIGLPGETYDSFVSGIDALLERGQHSQIIIYNCCVMPNAEMGDPAYREAHGVKTVLSPIFQAHSIPHDVNDPIAESEPVIVGTASMPVADWRRAYRFAWAVQCFHALGLLQGTAIFLRHYCGIPYRRFYEELLAFADSTAGGLLNQELCTLDRLLDRVLEGKGFDQVLPEFSDITWPPEEASLLRLSSDAGRFFAEIGRFVDAVLDATLADLDTDLRQDLLRYQSAIVVTPDDDAEVEVVLGAGIPEYVEAHRNNALAELQHGASRYRIRPQTAFGGDRRTYAREIVWFGRKGGRFMHSIVRVGGPFPVFELKPRNDKSAADRTGR